MRKSYSAGADERGLDVGWEWSFAEFATPYILSSIETLSLSCINDGSGDFSDIDGIYVNVRLLIDIFNMLQAIE